MSIRFAVVFSTPIHLYAFSYVFVNGSYRIAHAESSPTDFLGNVIFSKSIIMPHGDSTRIQVLQEDSLKESSVSKDVFLYHKHSTSEILSEIKSYKDNASTVARCSPSEEGLNICGYIDLLLYDRYEVVFAEILAILAISSIIHTFPIFIDTLSQSMVHVPFEMKLKREFIIPALVISGQYGITRNICLRVTFFAD